MKRYMIDYINGSGSGCDDVFDSREDAERHLYMNCTEKEREGLVIVEVEEE